MKTVSSFDIFDTLLARTVINPIDIFDIVERTFPYNNFKQLRIDAQNRSKPTIEDIYLQFKLLTGESDEQIKRLRTFELKKTEMENTIPIMSNILKINNGDIFVSDMYLYMTKSCINIQNREPS
jgi:predicted HAD superfamily hydrolase